MDNKYTHTFQNIIPIVFATDDNYFPYMAVSIQSVMENADPEQTFKIYVLCQNLSENYRQLLQKQIEAYRNFSIEYVDVSKHFENLSIRNLRYTVNSLFRLIIPYIFTTYKHVTWLDVDTICLTNIADFYHNTDEGSMLKCVKDIGVLAVIRSHAKKVGLSNYQKYFSAGVLVFNTELFRNNVKFEDMMLLEGQRDLPFADQEILNIVCENKVQYASMDWNVMCGKCEAYKNPKIIHYVWDKPWKSFFKTKRGKYFWNYAKKTPFYDIVVQQSKKKNLKDVVTLMKFLVVTFFAKLLRKNIESDN
ncbi:MAG: glycosyltransferase family 8 protein [Bacteroidales bacterium]|nr:glycosyltransferase family 8 protein [Bacteroidales bacterium]